MLRADVTCSLWLLRFWEWSAIWLAVDAVTTTSLMTELYVVRELLAMSLCLRSALSIESSRVVALDATQGIYRSPGTAIDYQGEINSVCKMW